MNETDQERTEALPATLTYWRTFPAESFDDEVRTEVTRFVAGISSTIPEWRAAARGDAGAAVSLVIKSRIPDRICIRADLAMTTLLACAFENAGAALVLSHMLARMPLCARNRARLSTSWLVHNVWLASRTFGRRSLPTRFPKGGEA